MDRFMESQFPPDLALDFTQIGQNSEAVKAALRGVGLPTIAGTFGQGMDIK
jgi:hypothetical protein